MAFKLDIFKLLSDIDKGDHTHYRALSADEKKGFAPLVVMRWMTGTSDEGQIIALNTFANKAIFPLSKHPELLMQLLQACSSKHQKRYSWRGIKSSKRRPMSQQVLKDYLEYSSLEVSKLSSFPPDEELIQMAEEAGWQLEEIKKLKAELKAYKE